MRYPSSFWGELFIEVSIGSISSIEFSISFIEFLMSVFEIFLYFILKSLSFSLASLKLPFKYKDLISLKSETEYGSILSSLFVFSELWLFSIVSITLLSCWVLLFFLRFIIALLLGSNLIACE